MQRVLRSASRIAPIAALALATHAGAVEVLVNGNLEASVAPPNWTLDQTITGQAGTVNATEQISFADQSGTGLGLFLRPFAGNTGDFTGLNLPINAVLSQTVNAFAGRTYTFTGGSRFDGDGDPLTDDGYSGGVATLDINSPSGAVPSPTTTTFGIEFLNSSNVVLSSVVRDLRTDFMQPNEPTWFTHTVTGVAPAGTARVRVTAAARNMVENTGGQNVYWDDFSLRDNVAATTERLVNGNLNLVGPPTGYTLTETAAPSDPDGVADTASFRDFANHTPGGQQGLWLRAFEGGDAVLAQTVPAVAGASYDFSAWSRWEVGYSGGLGDPTVVTFQRLEFLDANGTPVGPVQSLNLATAPTPQSNDGVWRQYTLNAVAPAGSASVRVSVGATGMFNSGFNPQSAFFDDLSLIQSGGSVNTGDFNGDGRVDGGDLSLLLANWGATVPPNPSGWTGAAPTAAGIDADELSRLLANWGFGTSTAIPEPSTMLMVFGAVCAVAGRRRG
jgi:hypothetical protein